MISISALAAEEVAELVVRALGQDQVHLPERVQ